MRTPDAWSGDGPLARLLDPIGRIYGWSTARRLARGPYEQLPIPVICVGNLVAGGAGKTPIVDDITRRLRRDHGLNAMVLSRGYGGRAHGPLRVDPGIHDAPLVGDEPLMLARAGLPVWIARDRAKGGRAAVADGAEALVMDDGFQNPALAKALSLVVVDGGFGFGNGRLIPAGPLREPVPTGLARADAVIIVGDDSWGVARRVPRDLPILRARVEPGPHVETLAGRRVVAFAGIGHPEKFFQSLERAGCRVIARHPFADHHPYQPTDIQPILDEAFSLGAVPLTTAKDAARLTPDQRQQVDVADLRLTWDRPTAVSELLAKKIA